LVAAARGRLVVGAGLVAAVRGRLAGARWAATVGGSSVVAGARLLAAARFARLARWLAAARGFGDVRARAITTHAITSRSTDCGVYGPVAFRATRT